MDRVVYIYLCLIVEIALVSISVIHGESLRTATTTNKKHVDGNLLPFVLEIIDIRPRYTLGGIGKYT